MEEQVFLSHLEAIRNHESCLADLDRRHQESLLAARNTRDASREAIMTYARQFLRKIARHETRQSADASDLAQVASMAAVASLASFGGNTLQQFEGWLRTILTRRAWHERDRSDGTEELGDRTELPAPDEPVSGPIREREAEALVQQAMRELTHVQRMIITLSQREWSSGAIAELLELHVDTVCRLRREACEFLQQYLGEP